MKTRKLTATLDVKKPVTLNELIKMADRSGEIAIYRRLGKHNHAFEVFLQCGKEEPCRFYTDGTLQDVARVLQENGPY